MTRKIIIFDLDGTLALIDHRRHWLDKEKHPELSTDDRWRLFFEACDKDIPNEPLIELLRSLYWADKYEIVILSGRSDAVEVQTRVWLNQYQVPYHNLRMRPAGDFTPDHALKLSWLEQFDKSQILCIFDDRKTVVDIWRSQGLLCCQVAEGDF